MRYDNWLRWRIADGTPPEVADAARGAGRKLLGHLMRQLELTGNLQGIMRQTLPDGTEIVARHDGTTPIVEIAGAGTGSQEPRCIGLTGHISDPVEVTNWPTSVGGFRPDVGFGLETFFFMGAYLDQVYMLYRTPHTGFPAPVGAASFVYDHATHAVKTYAEGVEYPRNMTQPPVVFRDKTISDNPLMTSPPFAQTDDERDASQFVFPIVDLKTGDQYTWTLTAADGDRRLNFGLGRAPTVFNIEGGGLVRANVVPLFVDEHTEQSPELVEQGVTLFDFKRRAIKGSRSVFDPALPRGAVFCGVKQRSVHVFGYANDDGPTDDEYIIDFDTGHATHRHLSDVPPRPALHAQVCDTFLMVGGVDVDGHWSGDVWLYTLGKGTRKVGHIPELDYNGDPADADGNGTPYSYLFSYLVPTPSKVYLFTPELNDPKHPDNHGLATKYYVRTIT